VVPLGSRPVISVIIAINSDGTRSQLTDSLVLTHTGAAVDVDGRLEQDRDNFQLYHYTFPPVQRSNIGTYAITAGVCLIKIAAIIQVYYS